jgi:transcriptional regulator with GAF, ATPase, and Fis domain
MLVAVKAQPIMLFTKLSDDKEFYDKLTQLGRSGAATKPAYFSREENEEIDVLTTSNTPVLLIGPPGSGKSVKARELAVRSGCAQDRIVSINCAGLSAELAEGMLFGYKKGAYTGATTNTPGLMLSASGFTSTVLNSEPSDAFLTRSPKEYTAYQAREKVWGAIILDEIGALDLRVQGKLLSVLEGEPIIPLGWTRHGFLPNFRIIAATNEEGILRDPDRFRRDLLRRLTTWVLRCLPSSEEPDEKIAELIRRTQIERRIEGRFEGLEQPQISPSAVEWLVGQKSKLVGGLRELHWVVHRAWLAARRRGGESITVSDMKRAWDISEEIYSALALGAEVGEDSTPAKVVAMRGRVAEVLQMTPSELSSRSFSKAVQREVDFTRLKAVLDPIVKPDFRAFELALGSKSKNIGNWYSQLFSRRAPKRSV